MRYLSILFFVSLITNAQIKRIEPPFWWEGMNDNKLQVLLYGNNIARYTVKSKGMDLLNVERVENENYLFLNFNLSFQKKGFYDIDLYDSFDRKIDNYSYEIKSREKGKKISSFNSSDVIYLIMPDRFANGNQSNDSHPDLTEKVNRKEQDGRHGGDIEGIIKNLDYLQELGITTIWSTPLCEDNDPKVSYHTYAQSDVYRIDPRFGTNNDYKRLAENLHQRGMKIIMDYVTNHWGIEHWMIKDLPNKDWIHKFDKYVNTNHRKEIHSDPYASKKDKKELIQGWFVPSMADLNQSNPLLLKYLIQNAIWWIEFANIDGFRVDTFPYNNPKPMVEWVKSIRNEYPNFNIVGEGWMHNTIHLSYWQENSPIADIKGFNSFLPSVMDFTLNDALVKSFSERNSNWEGGMTRIYKNLQNDFLYTNVNNLLIFAENHDTNRINDFYPELKDYKRMMSVLMTLRGIPQIYYGSEIGMTGKKENGDGDIRRDFPGGWLTDNKNAFLKEERTIEQNNYFEFTKKLLNWRKSNKAIHHGKTLHYTPQNDVYVYFRFLDNLRVMIVVNNSSEDQTILLDRFEEGLNGKYNGIEILSNNKITLGKSLKIKAGMVKIIELN